MQEENTYSVEEAANYLWRTPETIRKLLHNGELEGYHEDGDPTRPWRIPRRAVITFRKQDDERLAELREQRRALFDRHFETSKHFTTLSAGSILLVATFLQNIFPRSSGGELMVGIFTKGLIATSFVLFGWSLVSAGFFMYVFSGFRPSGGSFFLAPTPDQADPVEASIEGFNSLAMNTTKWSYIISFGSFVSGILCFGLAVLITVL